MALDLRLPSLFWKALSRETLTRHDLEAIDARALRFLVNLEKTGHVGGGDNDDEDSATDPEAIREVLKEFAVGSFTGVLSDGSTRELVPGGKFIKVGAENRFEWMELYQLLRLTEAKHQLNAILDGIYSIIPPTVFGLFSWAEMERLFCGSGEYHVDQLRQKTAYEGVYREPDNTTVQAFWQVMEKMDATTKSKFLLFVRGSPRLQPEDVFTLQPFPCKEPDKYLPRSRTCFFQLQLPAYTSAAILEEKLLFAMNNCFTMELE